MSLHDGQIRTKFVVLGYIWMQSKSENNVFDSTPQVFYSGGTALRLIGYF
jgi:hypothetical protein